MRFFLAAIAFVLATSFVAATATTTTSSSVIVSICKDDNCQKDCKEYTVEKNRCFGPASIKPYTFQLECVKYPKCITKQQVSACGNDAHVQSTESVPCGCSRSLMYTNASNHVQCSSDKVRETFWPSSTTCGGEGQLVVDTTYGSCTQPFGTPSIFMNDPHRCELVNFNRYTNSANCTGGGGEIQAVHNGQCAFFAGQGNATVYVAVRCESYSPTETILPPLPEQYVETLMRHVETRRK